MSDIYKSKIKVYIDDGTVYEYEVTEQDTTSLSQKIGEHAQMIMLRGYRGCDSHGSFVGFPPHRIDKIKAEKALTNYPHKIYGRGV